MLMNRLEIIDRYHRVGNVVRDVAITAFVGTTSVGGTAGGAFVGYELGDSIAPNAHTAAGKVLEYTMDTAGVLSIGWLGALVGFGIGVWALDSYSEANYIPQSNE